ncbi:MAG: ABC transporter substrate-binding protein [Deinococcales bacterium]
MRKLIAILLVAMFALAAAQDAVTLNYITGNRGQDVEYAKARAAEYTAMHPNVTINVIQGPESATDRAQQYLQFFEAQSGEVDVFEIDVIWPGDMAEHLLDLGAYDDLKTASADFFPAIVNNNTVDGHLVGMPYFTDAGLLYYRSDLLEKYGFDGPPTTWAELENMSIQIQQGEREAGNADFWGFVWQGNAYEGLTCDALEWVTSFGGGEIVDIQADGNKLITINNERAIAALNTAKGWVGTISPPGVTGYQEEDARNVWHAGNAAFMRNWPYAFSLTLNDSVVGSNFGVAALPMGPNGRSAATLGGWQLAVSKYSANPDAAADFVAFLTSHESQLTNAIERSLLPTRPAVYSDQALLDSDSAFMADFLPVFQAAVARPSTATAPRYLEVSKLFFDAVHSVLTGEEDAAIALDILSLDIQEKTGYDIASE